MKLRPVVQLIKGAQEGPPVPAVYLVGCPHHPQKQQIHRQAYPYPRDTSLSTPLPRVVSPPFTQ